MGLIFMLKNKRCRTCRYYRRTAKNRHYCIKSNYFVSEGLNDIFTNIPLICKYKDGGLIYRCDPEKNIECKKTNCYRNDGPCKHSCEKEHKMNIFKIVKEWFIFG